MDEVIYAGLSQEQAAAIAELFGGQHSLLGKPKRACIADLIAFYVHRSPDQRLWPQLCTVCLMHCCVFSSVLSPASLPF